MTHFKLILIGSLIAGGTLLAGCTTVPEPPVATTKPMQTPATPVAPKVTPVVQGDLEAADRAIDNQNLDTDFPSLDQQDLEK